MAEEIFNIFLEGKEGSIKAVADKYRLTHAWLPDNNTLNNNILWKTYETENYNFVMNSLENSDIAGVVFGFGCRTVKLKFNAPDTMRGCFIKFPNKVQVSGTNEYIETESLILASAYRTDLPGSINITSFPDRTPNTTYNNAYDTGTFYSNDNTLSRTTTARWTPLNSNDSVEEWVYSRYSGTVGGINHHIITDEQKVIYLLN